MSANIPFFRPLLISGTIHHPTSSQPNSPCSTFLFPPLGPAVWHTHYSKIKYDWIPPPEVYRRLVEILPIWKPWYTWLSARAMTFHLQTGGCCHEKHAVNKFDNNWIISNEKGPFTGLWHVHHTPHPLNMNSPSHNFVCTFSLKLLWWSGKASLTTKCLSIDYYTQITIFFREQQGTCICGIVAYQLMWYGPTTMSPFIVYPL